MPLTQDLKNFTLKTYIYLGNALDFQSGSLYARKARRIFAGENGAVNLRGQNCWRMNTNNNEKGVDKGATQLSEVGEESPIGEKTRQFQELLLSRTQQNEDFNRERRFGRKNHAGPGTAGQRAGECHRATDASEHWGAEERRRGGQGCPGRWARL